MSKIKREKAIALEIHSTFQNTGKGFKSDFLASEDAKACVDWILNVTTGDKQKQNFWRKVKKEIKEL